MRAFCIHNHHNFLGFAFMFIAVHLHDLSLAKTLLILLNNKHKFELIAYNLILSI